MNTISPNTLKRLHTVLGRIGITSKEVKADMIAGVTIGRTDSTKQLYEGEAIALIDQLQLQVKAEQDKADKMRKKVLAICHTLGWYKRSPEGELLLQHGKPKLDFERINSFCLQRSKYKKTLNKHSAAELPALITSFEKLLKTDLK